MEACEKKPAAKPATKPAMVIATPETVPTIALETPADAMIDTLLAVLSKEQKKQLIIRLTNSL